MKVTQNPKRWEVAENHDLPRSEWIWKVEEEAELIYYMESALWS